MPGGRKPGGKRPGTPGKLYPNRTDMSKPMAPTAVKGQAYGQAKEQMDAQAAVPMAGAPEGLPPAPVAPGSVGLPAPGTMPGMFDPSTDPTEDVMSGAASGPGPGPGAFGLGQKAAADKDMGWAAKYLPAMEVAANGPKGTDAARQIVRLLKARLEI